MWGQALSLHLYFQPILQGSVLTLVIGAAFKFLGDDFTDKRKKAQEEITAKNKIDQFKLEHLYSKRTEVIETISDKLTNLEIHMESAVNPLQVGGTKAQVKTLEIANSSGNEFLNFYNKKRMYLNERTCEIKHDRR